MVEVDAELSEEGRILIAAGIEFGNKLLINAVQKTDSVTQAENQLFLLRVASVHLLATCAFNHEQNYKEDAEIWLEEVITELRLSLKDAKRAFETGEAQCIATHGKEPNDD